MLAVVCLPAAIAGIGWLASSHGGAAYCDKLPCVINFLSRDGLDHEWNSPWWRRVLYNFIMLLIGLLDGDSFIADLCAQ